MAAIQRDPDTRRAVMLVPGKLVRLVEGGKNIFTCDPGLGGGLFGVFAQFFQHDHELIAAEPRHGVAIAHAPGETL